MLNINIFLSLYTIRFDAVMEYFNICIDTNQSIIKVLCHLYSEPHTECTITTILISVFSNIAINTCLPHTVYGIIPNFSTKIETQIFDCLHVVPAPETKQETHEIRNFSPAHHDNKSISTYYYIMPYRAPWLRQQTAIPCLSTSKQRAASPGILFFFLFGLTRPCGNLKLHTKILVR